MVCTHLFGVSVLPAVAHAGGSPRRGPARSHQVCTATWRSAAAVPIQFQLQYGAAPVQVHQPTLLPVAQLNQTASMGTRGAVDRCFLAMLLALPGSHTRRLHTLFCVLCLNPAGWEARAALGVTLCVIQTWTFGYPSAEIGYSSVTSRAGLQLHGWASAHTAWASVTWWAPLCASSAEHFGSHVMATASVGMAACSCTLPRNGYDTPSFRNMFCQVLHCNYRYTTWGLAFSSHTLAARSHTQFRPVMPGYRTNCLYRAQMI